jgi:hypothetical protein
VDVGAVVGRSEWCIISNEAPPQTDEACFGVWQ